MWYLISLENPDLKYDLLVGKSYMIGRRDCDIIITGDASISRKHAQIALSHPEANLSHPDKIPSITLLDVSKFGTWVNKERLVKDQGKQLQDGDELILGQKSSFTVVYEPFIISSSCLDNAAKKTVRSLMCVLGGHMVNDWKKDCSLLVMNTVNVTIKVICALVSLKNIVTPGYLKAYVEHLQGKGEKPRPEKFLPEITETQVDPTKVSFSPENRRQTLLQGMKFIFLNPKQFKRMSLAVELAGGLPVLAEEGGDFDKASLVEEGSVVMQSDPTDTTQGFSQQGIAWINAVARHLKKNKKRMILDPELGFAILHCDIYKYCNPDINMGYSQVLPQVAPPSLSQTDALVTNSEFVPKSPVIQGRYEPDAVNETKVEDIESRSMKKSSPSAPVIDVKKEPLSQETKKDSQILPGSPGCRGVSRRTKVAENEVVTTSSKKPKLEKITPAKPVQETLRRSARRSPSPAKVSPKQKISESSLEKLKPEQIIVVDSDEDLEMKPSAKHDSKKTTETPSKRSTDSSLKHAEVKNKGSTPRSKRKKGDMSDNEDEEIIPKRGKGKITQDESDEDVILTKKSEKNRGGKRNISDDDNDDDFFSVKSVKNRHGSKTTNKRINTEEEDLFDLGLNRKDHSKSRDSKQEDTVLQKADEGRSPERTESKSVRKRSPLSSPREDRLANIKTEDISVAEDSAGGFTDFINTHSVSEGQKVKTESSENLEKDLPSNCAVVKFVDLVVRQPKPKPRANNSEETPEGFCKWNGKLVKNFKKFKKAGYVGAGRLPRIIGGSDLEPYIRTKNKEIDDWFREEAEAQSQRNERERLADEYFECDIPRASISKRKGR